MYLDEVTVQKLNLTEDDKTLFSTPFHSLNKEGLRALFALGDRVFDEQNRQRDEEKQKQKEISEEERIHLNKENMIQLPRSFF